MWAVLAQAAHADCAPKLQVKYMFSQLAIYACSLVEIMFPVSKDNHLEPSASCIINDVLA
jgi:hypothetical protein